MKARISLLLLSLFCIIAKAGNTFTLSSPDKRTVVSVDATNNLKWSVTRDDVSVITPSSLTMSCEIDGKTFFYGKNMKTLGKTTKQENGFNTLTIKCEGNYNVEFRAYNSGVAYRFVNIAKKAFVVKNETSDYKFAGDYKAFVPYVNDNRGGERYCYSFESYYDKQKISEIYPDSLIISPMAICLPKGKKAVIMEANLFNYPGMFLKRNGQGISAEFAPYPLEEKIGGYSRLNLVPTKRADYIAKVGGRKFFPWRIIAISDNDTDLLTCDIAKQLGPSCKITDTSWIKPGKVAWDWWNNTNITGVDFKSGMNTPTYKYYIDFANKYNIEYIIIDEGWSDPEDLFKLNNDINLQELISYASLKNVGIILWSSWRNLVQNGNDKMEEIMSHYSSMGIKGFKVDFFDRDDQKAINSSYTIAECAANHHLLLDFHGMKPTGVQLAYPNILNFEAVKGLENSKWEPRNNNGPIHDQPQYDCEIPYLRMLPGAMDYTPGAMTNATKSQFFGNNDHPMSQGTRTHQVAMYTVFYAPLQMLADSPTKYMQNQECTDFIAKVPTTWDETIALDGKIGEYVAIARRKGTKWFIGVLNNWQEKDITLDLSKLNNHGNNITIIQDGINADKEATDYKKLSGNWSSLVSNNKITIHLSQAGGWSARIE